MSSSRPKRSTAGRLMGKLIEEQEDAEEDEFYKTTYGGFADVEDDTEYVEEKQVEDEFDSDFLDTESDDTDGENAEAELKQKRKKTVVKKATALKKKPIPKPGDGTATKSAPVKRAPKPKLPPEQITTPEKRARMRASTLQQVEAGTRARERANATLQKRTKKGPELRRLTQEELLAEAVVTEEENLASLAQFLLLEAEKKKTQFKKVQHQGPTIRFHSVRMPAPQDRKHNIEPVVNRTDTTSNQSSDSQSFCSRNFLVFSDEASFPKKYFPGTRGSRHPAKEMCVVTGLPARYKDPLTGLPYATMEAFKYIREHRKRLLMERQSKLSAKKRKKTPKESGSASSVAGAS